MCNQPLSLGKCNRGLMSTSLCIISLVQAIYSHHTEATWCKFTSNFSQLEGMFMEVQVRLVGVQAQVLAQLTHVIAHGGGTCATHEQSRQPLSELDSWALLPVPQLRLDCEACAPMRMRVRLCGQHIQSSG